MLLEPPHPLRPLNQPELARYETECAAFYGRCSRVDLERELQEVLDRLVKVRRELHDFLTQRQVDPAMATMAQLLHLEAQAAAVRRAHGDVALPPRPVPSGPQDRRKERRRTARE